MPYTIALPEVPAGFAMTSSRGGEMVQVASCVLVTPESGEFLYQALEIGSNLITQTTRTAGLDERRVQSVVALIRRDMTATVHVDEVRPIAAATARRSKVQAGDPGISLTSSGSSLGSTYRWTSESTCF